VASLGRRVGCEKITMTGKNNVKNQLQTALLEKKTSWKRKLKEKISRIKEEEDEIEKLTVVVMKKLLTLVQNSKKVT